MRPDNGVRPNRGHHDKRVKRAGRGPNSPPFHLSLRAAKDLALPKSSSASVYTGDDGNDDSVSIKTSDHYEQFNMLGCLLR